MYAACKTVITSVAHRIIVLTTGNLCVERRNPFLIPALMVALFINKELVLALGFSSTWQHYQQTKKQEGIGVGI
jgi:hypothetical protein